MAVKGFINSRMGISAFMRQALKEVGNTMNSLSSAGSINPHTINDQITNIQTNSPSKEQATPLFLKSGKVIEPRVLSDYKVSRSTSPSIETAITSIKHLPEKIEEFIEEKYSRLYSCDSHLKEHSNRPITNYIRKNNRRFHKNHHRFRKNYHHIQKNYHRLASECMYNSPESITINQFLKHASDEERVIFFSRALAEPSVDAAIVDRLHRKMVNTDPENKSGMNYLSKAYQRLYSNKTGRTDIPEGGKVDDTVPVNFIWVGSPLPDRYLENVKTVASAIPHREVVIWIDRHWMTPEEYSKMKALPTLPELAGLNCKVLDINDAGLADAIPKRCRKFKEALKFLREQCDHKAMASDLIRYALLAKGSDAIDEASHLKTRRATKGMIYLDTDRGSTEPTPTQWGEMQAPAGILLQKELFNDFLVTTFEKHPVFLSALNMAIDRLSLEENKQILARGDRNHESFISTVLKTTGPELLEDAVLQFIQCDRSYFFPRHLELHSLVAGPHRSDKTWIATAPKVDLSATWTSKIAEEESRACSLSRSCTSL